MIDENHYLAGYRHGKVMIGFVTRDHGTWSNHVSDLVERRRRSI